MKKSILLITLVLLASWGSNQVSAKKYYWCIDESGNEIFTNYGCPKGSTEVGKWGTRDPTPEELELLRSRQQQEWDRKMQMDPLNTCLTFAQEKAKMRWAEDCRLFGVSWHRDENGHRTCRLPLALAESLNNDKRHQENICISLHGSK